MCFLSQVNGRRGHRRNDIIPPKMTVPRDAEAHHLIGGMLCLDFANTLYGHAETIHEYLFDYRDLVLWSRHAGIFDRSQAEALLSKWEQDPPGTEPVFRHAIQLREEIYQVFASIAQNKPPQESDVTHLHQSWVDDQIHSKLVRSEAGFRLGWENGSALDSMLWRISGSAMDLLTSDDLERVKQCGRCDWLFVDRSRNQRRRWCSMSACGNRVKMARRYERERQEM